MPDEQKKMSRERMYEFLMRRAGRGEEWDTLTAKFTAENPPVKFGDDKRIRWKVLRAMGFPGHKATERAYIAALKEDGVPLPEDLASSIPRAPEEVESDIEAACAKIPGLVPVAPPGIEMAWVTGHPAIMRKDLNQNLTFVVITEKDILGAPHGLPPSRRSVSRLVHYANRPSELHKSMSSIDRKADWAPDEATANEAEEACMALQKVRELLREFAANKNPLRG